MLDANEKNIDQTLEKEAQDAKTGINQADVKKVTLLTKLASDFMKPMADTYKKSKENFRYSFFKTNPIGKIYARGISLLYALVDLPASFINMLPGPLAFIGKITWMILSYPLKTIISLIDIETYLSIADTLFSLCWNCVIKGPFKILKYFGKQLSRLLAVMTFIKKKRNQLKRLQEMEILEESIISKITGKLLNIVKIALKPFIFVIKWIFKVLFKTFKKVLMVGLYPIARCISNNNKLKINLYAVKSLQTAISSGLIGKGVFGSVITNALGGNVAYLKLATASVSGITFMGMIGMIASGFIISSLITLTGRFFIITDTLTNTFGEIFNDKDFKDETADLEDLEEKAKSEKV